MKRVKNRMIALVLIAALLVVGVALYIVKFAVSGAKWTSSRVNGGVYSGNTLILGSVIDRNGIVLADISDGERIFAEENVYRRATLHAVGDAAGNIGTGALSAFKSLLIGYDPIFGTYSLDGTGGKVTLSVDAELNAVAYEAMAGRSGAVIVVNYETCEVLCMVSTPTFDPETPGEVDVDSAAYNGVYLNRALSAAYTPGSVFKIITAAAAIENIDDIHERTFHCSGRLDIGADAVTCPSRHGDIDFDAALAQSCNVAFAELAMELGASTLAEYCADYGLTERLDIDGIATAVGRYDEAAPGTIDLAWSGAGQYNNLASPVAMARLAAAIANGGRAPDLTLIKPNLLAKPSFSQIMNPATSVVLRRMMRGNVRDNYGTDSFPGLDIGAKSGTAEVGRDSSPHAWFVGFIENDDAPLAFAVIVENGGSGKSVAGEVAAKVLSAAVR